MFVRSTELFAIMRMSFDSATILCRHRERASIIYNGNMVCIEKNVTNQKPNIKTLLKNVCPTSEFFVSSGMCEN